MKKTLSFLLMIVMTFIITISLLSACGQTINQEGNGITDEKIMKELEFIQEVLQVNKSKVEIEKSFDNKYHKHIIPRKALDLPNLQGINDIHFYIFNNSSKLLNLEVGESFDNGLVVEVKDHSLIVENNNNLTEYFEEFIYNNMDLFVDNLLLKRKSGIRIEILYSDKDLVRQANIFYVNEENKISTISYAGDGTITIYENVTKDEHYKSF